MSVLFYHPVTYCGVDYLGWLLDADCHPQVISVFEYLNSHEINSHLSSIYGSVSREWRNFEDAVNKAHSINSVNTYNLWREFITTFMNRMASWAETWVRNRLSELEGIWTQEYQNAMTDEARNNALRILRDLARVRELTRYITFDSSMFMFPF